MRGGLRYLEGVVSLEYDPEKCTGCAMCTHVCPHGVFEMGKGKARILDRDLCMECGACMMNCPVKAIQVEPGVGCAYAVIRGRILGTGPDCGGGDKKECCQ